MVQIKSFFLIFIIIFFFGCQNNGQNDNNRALDNNKPKHERLPDSLFTIHINYKDWHHGKLQQEVQYYTSFRENRRYFSQKYNKEDGCLDLQFRLGFTQENILLRIRPYESENSTVTKAFYIRWSLANAYEHDGFNMDAYKEFVYMDTIFTNLDAKTFKSIYPKFRGVVRHSVIDSLIIKEDLSHSMGKNISNEVKIDLFVKYL